MELGSTLNPIVANIKGVITKIINSFKNLFIAISHTRNFYKILFYILKIYLL